MNSIKTWFRDDDGEPHMRAWTFLPALVSLLSRVWARFSISCVFVSWKVRNGEVSNERAPSLQAAILTVKEQEVGVLIPLADLLSPDQ